MSPKALICLFFTLFVAQLLPAQDAKPTPESIVNAYLKAIGGKEAMQKIKSTYLTGHFTIEGAGVQGKLEIFQLYPDKALLKVTIPGLGNIQQGFDGKTGWMVDPISGASLAKDKVYDQLKESSDLNFTLYDRACFKSMEYAGSENYENKLCHKLKLVSKSGTEMTDYFDASSGLLLGRKSRVATPQGEVDSESIYSEYKTFGAIKQPTVFLQKLLNQSHKMTIEKIEFDKVDPKEFEMPAAIKALLPGENTKK